MKRGKGKQKQFSSALVSSSAALKITFCCFNMKKEEQGNIFISAAHKNIVNSFSKQAKHE
jgi:hypothetical protein